MSFGLVSIPVQLYSATRNARVSLRMLAPDGSPVVRRYFCPEHDKQVDQDELARGYEYKPGKYVQVSDEELEALEPDKSRDIDLRLFVPASCARPGVLRADVLPDAVGRLEQGLSPARAA